MEKGDSLVHFDKYIPENKDVTAEDALSSCCLDGKCEKKESED